MTSTDNNHDIKKWIKNLDDKVEEIEECAEIAKHHPTDEEAVSALKFLEREWSLNQSSGWRFACKKIKDILDNHPALKKKYEHIIEQAEQRVRNAIKVTGEIFPGRACRHFVISCNEHTEKIVMRTKEENGFEQESVFRIKSNNKTQWNIIRQLIESDSYPMSLSLPKGRDIANIFRDTKTAPKDDARKFSRYIFNEVQGMYATYSLRQVATPDKRKARNTRKRGTS